jgi:E3 ubiquitin-protein ligase SH3RF
LKADELRLTKGDLYIVIEKCEDGWFKGSSLNTLKTGVFPGNYMQHVRDEKQNAFATSSTSTASTSSTAAVASSSRTPTASFQQQKVWHDVAKPKSGDLV